MFFCRPAIATLSCLCSVVLAGPASADAAKAIEVIRAGISAPGEPSSKQSRDFGDSGEGLHPSAGQTLGPFLVRQAGIAIEMRSSGPLLLQNITVSEARACIAPDKGRPSTINDVTVARFSCATHKRGIYIRGDSAGWDIGSFKISYNGATSSPGDIPVGIEIDGTARDIVIHDGEISGFINDSPAGYPNADCTTAERGNDRITYRNLYVHDCTDGGIDTKATNVVLDNVVSARHRRNFRLWGKGTGTTLYSVDPRGAHIWLGVGADFTLSKVVFEAQAGAPLVECGAPTAKLTIADYDIRAVPPTTTVEKSCAPGQVDWGAKGRPDLGPR